MAKKEVKPTSAPTNLLRHSLILIVLLFGIGSILASGWYVTSVAREPEVATPKVSLPSVDEKTLSAIRERDQMTPEIDLPNPQARPNPFKNL